MSIELAKKNLSNTMYQFSGIQTREEMLGKYKWYSFASAIKNEELTLKLMKEILREGCYHYYQK